MLTRREFLWKALAGVAGGILVASRGSAAMAKQIRPPPHVDLSRDGVTVLARSEWATQEARPWLMRDAGVFDRLTVHHTGSEMPIFTTRREAIVEALNNILREHLERSYGDVGYHYLVDYAGRVWEGRSLAYEGAHVQDQNETNLGVVLLGNFDEQQPSGEQLASMFRLVHGLRRSFSIKLHRVYGHRDLGYTACPGQYVYAYVKQLKS